MKKTNELKQLKKEKANRKMIDYKWIFRIAVLAFIISLLFSFTSEMIIPNVNIVIGIIIVILFIGIGVLFDIIGVAVTSSDEKPFHSMSSRKVRGASIAVNFIKNADKVSSFCNDVIGDICGIVSGSAGVIIAISLSKRTGIDQFVMTLLVTALIASFTIGGKAMGKSVAINKSNIILYKFSQVISFFYNKN